jgi:hypothetical protein
MLSFANMPIMLSFVILNGTERHYVVRLSLIHVECRK